MTALLLDLLTAVAVAGGMYLGHSRRGASADIVVRRRGGWIGEPGFWLAMVIATILVNQVLFTVYVTRVHHCDTSFVARFLPSGWFDTACGNPSMAWLAARFPAPDLLSITVLRVQAFLELPFTILAYLTVYRWFGGPSSGRRTTYLFWAACATYTAAFILIELKFRNPYTNDDIIVRAMSGVLTPTALVWLFRRYPGDGDRHVGSARDLLLATASTAALGLLVLVVYDTALLYNLARSVSDAPLAGAAAIALVAARLAARRPARPPLGTYQYAICVCIQIWLLDFFVAALPIRYTLGFGSRWVAIAAAAAIAGSAATSALRKAARDKNLTVTLLALRLSAAVMVATTGAAVGLLLPSRYPEVRLLAMAVLFVGIVSYIARRIDRVSAPGSSTQDPGGYA